MAKKRGKGRNNVPKSLMTGTMKRVSSMGSMNTNGINNNVGNTMSFGWTIAMLIALAIGLSINVSALLWINKLEEINCACSEHWMRKYIKYYLYFLIPLSIINAIITIYRFNTPNYSQSFYQNYKIFTHIFGFFGFANIFIAVIFINRLKEINCVCSEDIKREVYWIYNIILLAIICINILFTLIMMPFLIYMLYKK